VKIFLSFLQSKYKHPIPAYSFWEYYLKNGIEEAGHQWVECPDVDWALGLVPQSKGDYQKWKQASWAKTLLWLKDNPADLFLCYLYPRQIDIAALKAIQKTGIPCVNFFCDNVRQFKKLPFEFSVFDLNWVPEFKAIKLYRKAGYPCVNLPMPVWIEPRFRMAGEEKLNQITFIGSKDIQRKLLFEKVLEADPEMQLSIYGGSWMDKEIIPQIQFKQTIDQKISSNLTFIKSFGILAWIRKMQHRNSDNGAGTVLTQKIHPSPSSELYNTLTSQSMITLGVNRYPSFRYPFAEPDTYSRLRDIEAPMLGACYLTEWTEGIDGLYDLDNEIKIYRTPADLIDQVKALQSDPVLRLNFRINGQKKALSKHSISQSLTTILGALGV
jgi:hypothetical protein